MGPLARRLGLLLLGLWALAACAPRPLPPEARYLGAALRGLELTPEPALLLEVRVAFRNPNPFPLPLSAFGTRLRLGEVGVPLDLTLPPGEKEALLPVRLTPREALATAQDLLSPKGGGGPGGPGPGPRPHLLQSSPGLPLGAPPGAPGRGQPLPGKPKPPSPPGRGTLVLLGQRLSVRADLPARGRGSSRWWACGPGWSGEADGWSFASRCRAFSSRPWSWTSRGGRPWGGGPPRWCAPPPRARGEPPPPRAPRTPGGPAGTPRTGDGALGAIDVHPF